MAEHKAIRIGGASGYWGDADMAVPQLLGDGNLDFIVFDYLAEITMSIMARARAKNPQAGYATDFVTAVIQPHLSQIAAQGIRLISNAGGVNPRACAQAVRAVVDAEGLDLKVAVISGDDLLGQAPALAAAGRTEMFSGEPFPPVDQVTSVSAYLGAFPIAEALARGADIVITGRVVDSAVTLGACIHGFGWARDEWDKLAGASLAGHIIECGTQATGGNFTDWEQVADTLADAGYPIVEIHQDGSFITTKPVGTGGMVSVGTVGEQMLYEIGDPQAYLLPDVVADFSQVTLTQLDDQHVRVSGARGDPAPDTYKVSATYADGWRAGVVLFFYGEQANIKAHTFAEAALTRTRRKLQAAGAADFDEVLVEVHGEESHYGEYARTEGSREVTLKLAVKHPDRRAANKIIRESTGLGLAAPPGLTGYNGGRPKASPVVRLFSLLVAKNQVPISLSMERGEIGLGAESGQAFDALTLPRPAPPVLPEHDAQDLRKVPLVALAWGRSGDKGDKANVGVLPRDIAYAPWIWAALTEQEVASRFAHFLHGPVERFYLPGTGAINFLLHDVLGGGGVASLRNDPQGKGYAQLLLQTPIAVPSSLASALPPHTAIG